MFKRQIIGIVGNSKKSFSLLHPIRSVISTLLHLVGLRPRVYYTLTNFRGGGGKVPLPPLQYANAYMYIICMEENMEIKYCK